MKKITIWVISLSLTVISCKKNFLDPKIVNPITTEAGTFSDSARAIQFVNAIYGNIYWAYTINRFNGRGNFAGACDEAVNRDQSTSNQANYINQATLTAVNIGAGAALTTSNDRGYWLVFWIPIRAANIAIRDLPNAPLPEKLKKRLIAEARFLKAFYFSTLMKYYGGVPLIGDTVFSPDSAPDTPRGSLDATVSYIVSECDAAYTDLYNESETVVDEKRAQIWDGPKADVGRVTKGACLALKARVLLYAASPLFNGGNIASQYGYAHPELTGYLSYNKERWKLAADAAQAVIDGHQYMLSVDNSTAPGYGFYKVFITRPAPPQTEFIFTLMQGPNNLSELEYDMPSRGANGNVFPYQELVDCFPMNNGKAITDPTSGYDSNNPYNNRDPRFNYTIVHNESLRFLASAGTQTKVFTYYNATNDGYPITATGYYVMKTIDQTVTSSASATRSNRCYALIRYAEILLSKAEAVNEYAGPTTEVYSLLGQIRARAGITPGANGLYGIPAGLGVDDMRLVIQNERRIELAFEDQRIWDMHRWKISKQLMDKTQHGVKIVPAGSSYTYTPVNANATRWFDHLYLFPFSQYEIVRNPAMFQNPGW